jgi:tetratricopeptide (TPR) repeat protein
MKLGRVILLFFMLLLLLPSVAWPQASSLAKDQVFRAARKAQQEGRIADAEKILSDRIHAIEQTEPNSPALVPYLNLLAQIYEFGKREGSDAHAIYERVLGIDRSAFGPGDSRSVRDLVNLASTLGPEKSDEKEQLLKQALDFAVQNPKPAPDMLAGVLSNLAALYKSEQRWHEAEPLAEQGMKICVSMPMPGTCEFLQSTLAEVYRGEGRTVDAGEVSARSMDANLPPELDALEKAARRYEDDGLYVQAEFSYRQAVAWIEGHPTRTEGKMVDVFTDMLPGEYGGIGRMLEKQGRDVLAEESYKKAIELQEASASENPMSIRYVIFFGLMNLYRKESRLTELEPIVQHALELQTKFIGESSISVARTLMILADLYMEETKYTEAKPLYERALKIEETNLGPSNSQLLAILSSYADLLVKMHEDAKASEIQSRIDQIGKTPAH